LDLTKQDRQPKDLSERLYTSTHLSSRRVLFSLLYINTDAKSVTVGAIYTACTRMGSTKKVTGPDRLRPTFRK
jgi:hypothetical protein